MKKYLCLALLAFFGTAILSPVIAPPTPPAADGDNGDAKKKRKSKEKKEKHEHKK